MFSCFGGWQVICCIFFFIGVIPNGTGLFSSLQSKEPGEVCLRHQGHITPTYAHAHYYQYFLLVGLQSTFTRTG